VALRESDMSKIIMLQTKAYCMLSYNRNNISCSGATYGIIALDASKLTLPRAADDTICGIPVHLTGC
jgi:hypothetical protein